MIADDQPVCESITPDDETWLSPVQAARRVDDPSAVSWDLTTDLIVVGFGAAGVAAALEAREDGLQVLALDKAEGGGATVLSGGVLYAGGGTRVQRDNNEQDTPDNMFQYLKLETQGVVRDETLQRFCAESPATVDWLMGHGVQFSGPVYKTKTSYPNPKYFLYHSDNSLLPAYQQHATPAARGHRGVTSNSRKAINLGGSIFFPLREAALKSGVLVQPNTEARQLALDPAGRVIGIRCLQFVPGSEAEREHQQCLVKAARLARMYPFFLPGSGWFRGRARAYAARARELEKTARVERWYRARRGICLSAGGFVFNRKMVRHYLPSYAPGMPMGTPADNGSGIRLGQTAGGAVRRMSRGTAWRFINPPRAWSQGIMVGAGGERFVNECAYGATVGEAMVERSEGKAWLILDRQLVRQSWREIMPGKVLPFQRQLAALNLLFGRKKFATLKDLAAHYGFDPQVLAESVQATRCIAAGELPDPFDKPSADVHPLQPPFHVIDVSLNARLLPCTVMTVGGLAVNEETGQVINDQAQAIPGLYAAGRTAVGLPSHLYMSGLSIADGIFAGRRAGRHVAMDVD